MGNCTVSLAELDQDSAGIVERVSASLGMAGFQVSRTVDRCEPYPKVVMFTALCPSVIHSVEHLSRSGFDRLLAVATAEEPMSAESHWDLLAAGASDVLDWTRLEKPEQVISSRLRRWHDVDELVNSPQVQESCAGISREWVTILRRAVEVARFSKSNILLVGESGTGKEVLARLIHAFDPRAKKKDLVVLDCATVVPELSGSEFFGHERGAFTSALVAREGAFAVANEGTLFLDEFGELPPRLQAELLRVIQERIYKPVGSNLWRKADFRLICATNRDLTDTKTATPFRQDLYHRVATCTLRLPPLSERREDILPLAEFLVRRICTPPEAPSLDPLVRDYLRNRDYPGNVRELRQLIQRMADRYVGPGPMTIGVIPEQDRPFRPERDTWHDRIFERAARDALARGKGLEEIRQAAADTAFRVAIEDERSDTGRMAARLKVSTRAVQMRIKGSGTGYPQ